MERASRAVGTRWLTGRRLRLIPVVGTLLVAAAPALFSALLTNLAGIDVVKMDRGQQTLSAFGSAPAPIGGSLPSRQSDSWGRAERLLWLAEAIWPWNAVAAARTADLRLAGDDLDGAETALRRAGALGAGPITSRKLGDLHEEKGRMEAAVAAWSLAGGVEFLLSKVDRKIRDGKMREAAQILEVAGATYPGDFDLDRRLVSLLMTMGERHRAVAVLRERVATHSEEVGGYLLLGGILAAGRSAEQAEAASLLQEAADRFQGDSRALAALAELYLRQGDKLKAAEQYELAAGRNPRDGQLYLKLAALQSELGQYREAVRSLEAGYQQPGKEFPLAMALVHAYERVGDAGSAERMAQVASTLAGSSGDAYGEVAEWYRGTGRFEEAASEYLKAAKFAVHRQFAWLGPWRAAECFESAGEWAKAADVYREAVAGIGDVGAPPTFQVRILAQAAEAELRLGRKEAATRLLRRAVAVDANNRSVRERLAALEGADDR